MSAKSKWVICAVQPSFVCLFVCTGAEVEDTTSSVCEMETHQEENIDVLPANNKKRIAFFSLVALVLVVLGVASTSASSAIAPSK